MEDRDNLPFVIGAVVALLAGAFLYADRYQHISSVQSPDAPTVATESLPAQQPKSLSDTLPAYAAHQPDVQQVYECTSTDKRVFSDAPCGDNATVRTLSRINGMDAHQTIYQADPALATPTRRSTEQDDNASQRRDCSGYEDDVKRIDARMRMGYTSSEGEYWHARRRDAAAARDDCKRDNRLR